jgi:hypothetical protein
MARRRAVADGQPDQSRLRQGLRVRPDATGMTQVPAVRHRDLGRAGQRNQSLDHAHAHDLTESASSVDGHARRAGLRDLGLRTGIDDPDSISARYWGMRMTPWECRPIAVAALRCSTTICACSGGAPARSSSARPSVSTSAARSRTAVSCRSVSTTEVHPLGYDAGGRFEPCPHRPASTTGLRVMSTVITRPAARATEAVCSPTCNGERSA